MLSLCQAALADAVLSVQDHVTICPISKTCRDVSKLAHQFSFSLSGQIQTCLTLTDLRLLQGLRYSSSCRSVVGHSLPPSASLRSCSVSKPEARVTVLVRFFAAIT